ncbi:hypothetical protein GCM10028818_41820 [Spirosoma horti]
MFEITFKLTESELYKGLVAISRSRFIIKAFRIIGITWVILYSFILYSDIAHGVTPSFYAIFFMLFGLYIIFIAEISSKFQSSKLIKTNAQITEQTTYVFDETSYQLTGESFSSRMTYNKLFEVREVGDFVLLRVTEGSANILPKRVLSTDQFSSLKQTIVSVPKLKSKFK